MEEQEIFSQKAPHYLLCFANECPMKSTCLHWLVGQQLRSDEYIVSCINPMHPNVLSNQCTYYREKKMARHAKGMIHFYDNMSRAKEISIKNILITEFGRRKYYEFRNGVRLISPDIQEFISKVCQEEGWTDEPQYDSWTEDYLW